MTPPPSYIGAYRLLRKLGEGGMGAVYEALQETIEKRVAIKILHPDYARDADLTKRFFNEARAVNRIDHPSLVQIHEYGHLPDGTAYLVMEYLKGETLAQRIRTLGRVPAQLALQITWQVAAALTAAHEKAIVHRDLKPANLMLVPDPLGPGGERVKVLDFGIAKLAAEAHLGKTATSVVMGTPAYMSPEQCRGAGTVDDKTDVYSLGVILFEMLAGRPPFIAPGAGELMGMHIFQTPPSILELAPDIPADIAAFAQLMMSKERPNRPSMRDAFEQLLPLAATASPNSAGAALVSASHKPVTLAGADAWQRQPATHGTPSVTVSIVGDQHVSAVRTRRPLLVTLLGGGALVTAGLVWLLTASPPSTSRAAELGKGSVPLTPASVPPATANLTPGKEWPPGIQEDPSNYGTLAKTSTTPTTSSPENRAELSTKTDRRKKSGPGRRHELSDGDGTPKPAINASLHPVPAATLPKPVETDLAVIDSVLNEAQAAYTQGRYSRAIELARMAQPDRPQPAWLLIGSAACRIHAVKLADQALQILDSERQRFLLDACLKQGIVRQRGAFTLTE